MADHLAFPLWSEGGFGLAANQQPPISQETRELLRVWAAEYDRNALTVEWGDLVDDWNERGRALAQRVADEAGDEWRVLYFDEITAADEVVVPTA